MKMDFQNRTVVVTGGTGALGRAVVGALLVYEQSLVSADDLSQVKKAFDMNGVVGIIYESRPNVTADAAV